LLSGIATCGHCGHRLVSQPRDGKPHYTCKSGRNLTNLDHGCGRIRIKAEPFEEDVLNRLFASLRPTSLDPGPLPAGDDTEALRAVERLEAVARDLSEMLGGGEMTRDEFRSAKARNDHDLDKARAELAAYTIDASHDQIVADAADLEARWHGLDIEEQRRFIGELFTAIQVGPALKGRNTYDPHRVRVEFAF
jgi:hypothetical protein